MRALELSNMCLTQDDNPNQNQQGSWVQIIHFLSEMLYLEHIKFDGWFTNWWDEAWST